jgi:dimethylglycine dehydrogenase
MKSHARVVIVGGGIMGVGLLYHLVQEGWTDVVLVEKGELTSGSTWHAAGQCPHFVGSLNLAKIHHEGTLLYPKLEELTGEAVSWHGCGGIRLAITDEEVEWFKKVYGVSKLIGYEAHLLGPDEIREHHPYLETFGVKMGYMTVTDGHVAPADVTNAMAAGARQGGAEIYRRTLVTDIKQLPSGEWQVITDKGNIVCEHVVNAAGSYADVVGAWTGHNVPICNMLHHYIITEPLQELIDLPKELPVIRDPYSHSYLREETNGVLVGPYETEGAHVCWDGNPPTWDFENELITPELDRLMPWLEKATERMPLFGQAGIKSVISGAITHTPDANFLLGPHRARRTTGCATALPSASARVQERASISRSGWCTVRPTSTWPSSIRAGSATGPTRTTWPSFPSLTISTCTTATAPASSTWTAARFAPPPCMTG